MKAWFSQMMATPSVTEPTDADLFDYGTASTMSPAATNLGTRDVKRNYADVISEVRHRQQVCCLLLANNIVKSMAFVNELLIVLPLC